MVLNPPVLTLFRLSQCENIQRMFTTLMLFTLSGNIIVSVPVQFWNMNSNDLLDVKSKLLRSIRERFLHPQNIPDISVAFEVFIPDRFKLVRLVQLTNSSRIDVAFVVSNPRKSQSVIFVHPAKIASISEPLETATVVFSLTPTVLM